jgi:hypothetical protein
MFAPEGFSLLTASLIGCSISYAVAVAFGIGMAALFMAMFVVRAKNKSRL